MTVLKPKCGRRMQLRVSNNANAINILVKAKAKWGQYNKDLHDLYGDYKLLFEYGEEVNTLWNLKRFCFVEIYKQIG